MSIVPGGGWYAQFQHGENTPHPYTTKHPIVVWTTTDDGRPQGWFSPDDAKTFGGILLSAESRSNFVYYARDPEEEYRLQADLAKEEWSKSRVEVELATGRTFVGRFDEEAFGPDGFICFVLTDTPDDLEQVWVRADAIVSIRSKERYPDGVAQPVDIDQEDNA